MESSTIYEPLQGSRVTRALYLYAGSKTDEICCELDVISLDDDSKPKYEALSYVWGPIEPRHWVKVNGIAKSVTENLAIAIRTLRREDGPLLLWIDALCINQDDSNT